jgi:hypothetical protein
MRRRLRFLAGGLGLLAGVCLLLPACESGGHFTILGYTTRPNYDCSIRTVRVGIFKNETYRQGLEFKLHQAVIREIEAKTPWKVVPAWRNADAELSGKIVARTKNLLVYNQLGEVRDAETTMSVELVFKDLRPGHIGDPLNRPLPDPNLPPMDGPPLPEPKTLVQSLGNFRPELGQSLASAEQEMVDRMAVQIVSMMERPW